MCMITVADSCPGPGPGLALTLTWSLPCPASILGVLLASVALQVMNASPAAGSLHQPEYPSGMLAYHKWLGKVIAEKGYDDLAKVDPRIDEGSPFPPRHPRPPFLILAACTTSPYPSNRHIATLDCTHPTMALLPSRPPSCVSFYYLSLTPHSSPLRVGSCRAGRIPPMRWLWSDREQI
jgi:hypothetical protein